MRLISREGAAAVASAALAGVAARDLRQRQHAILRNYPLVGHFRYLLESLGPELRQYVVTSNDEERPFSRDQRRWVYASSKKQLNTFGFGTDNDLEQVENLLIIKQAAFPAPASREGTPGDTRTTRFRPERSSAASTVAGTPSGPRRSSTSRG